MTNKLAHRGPDFGSTFIDETIALGHRRLSILDTSNAGAQPMWDSTERYVIVYNGEIYNYQQLKQRLPHISFKSSSDTEVILESFVKFGVSVFNELNGIFAFVIYDTKSKNIWVVRDRFGIKPLYYSQKNQSIYFASELKALIASGDIATTPSDTAIYSYLLYGSVWGNQSILSEVSELPAGPYLSSESGNIEIVQYNTFYQNVPISSLSYDDIVSKTRNLLFESVESQLISDVPLGAFLSGGIDSSAIVAIMSHVNPKNVNTFSIGFKEEKFDETPFANIISKKFKTNHTRKELSADEFLNFLPAALEAMDTPTIDGLNTYVVSKLTKENGLTVALSGLGGDELFCGYSQFHRFKKHKESNLWKIPRGVRALAGAFVKTNLLNPSSYRKKNYITIPKFDLSNVYPIYRRLYDPSIINRISKLNFDYPVLNYLKENEKYWQNLPTFSQYSLAEMTQYTKYMLLKDTDQFSMASSLEVRVPFFDNNLVNAVIGIPDSMKFKQNRSKDLLLKIMGNDLPEEIYNRNKMGFTLPWEEWLRGPLKNFVTVHFSQFASRGLLDHTFLNDLLYTFMKGTPTVSWSMIWSIAVLDYWLERNNKVTS
jgi:asparagine synthase (glutamine-hydrolysing)